jgi:hypothetical protein
MVAKRRCWQQKKTHCAKGHPYDERNTRLAGPRRTHRVCRTCKAEQIRRRRAKKRELLAGLGL